VTAKRVIPRALSNLDVEQAISRYLKEAGAKIALGFVDDLERAYAHISRHPATGSSRYETELNLPGLRFWALTHYPHLVFYLERRHQIDVWRVLHAKRDIPAWMQGLSSAAEE
jgi:toxin ParE1/3/4